MGWLSVTYMYLPEKTGLLDNMPEKKRDSPAQNSLVAAASRRLTEPPKQKLKNERRIIYGRGRPNRFQEDVVGAFDQRHALIEKEDVSTLLAEYQRDDDGQEYAKGRIRRKFIAAPETQNAELLEGTELFDNEFMHWCLRNNFGPGNDWGNTWSKKMMELDKKYGKFMRQKYEPLAPPKLLRTYAIRIPTREEREKVDEAQNEQKKPIPRPNVRFEEGIRLPNEQQIQDEQKQKDEDEQKKRDDIDNKGSWY
jgi:hypothetical protein